MLVPAVRARRSKLPFTWMQFLIVARREIFRKLLNRSFIVAMIGSLALVGAVAIFQYLQTSKSDKNMVIEADSACSSGQPCLWRNPCALAGGIREWWLCVSLWNRELQRPKM